MKPAALVELQAGNAAIQAYRDTNPSHFLEDLMLDMESENELHGQLMKAVSCPDWFARWGRHYLRSVACGHRLQFCNNFKDAAVQHYGGLQAKEMQNQLRLAFCALPPPTPSLPTTVAVTAAYMSTYMDATIGCFDGQGEVKMAYAPTKPVWRLNRGDEVATPYGSAKVVCVVVTPVAGRSTHMVNIGGVLLTPWHPVLLSASKAWTFPCDHASPYRTDISHVYNVVLDRHHIIVINGVQCVTMGHDFTGPVVGHDYFGSRRVVDDLATQAGWTRGRVILTDHAYRRDPVTGQVCGMVR